MSGEQEPAVWACEAYGAEGAALGALCFFSAAGRACGSQQECATAMSGERQRVFDRITELAAAGDPDMQFLAAEFTSPDQLLNSSGDRGEPGVPG